MSQHLSNVLQSLENNELSVAGLVQQILKSDESCHRAARESLTRNAPGICSALYTHRDSKISVLNWTMNTMKRTLCREVEELTRDHHGLHFKATSATAEQQEGSMMQNIASKMKRLAPHLWETVHALLDSVPGRR
ncbi:hypothetical protein BV22DRAFT_1024082 [Leucogyrophana mollusca]|uniref:Uncharacterized protein n=1 Tax=Leucogyrophana mollusca TaxID=85980 RepID=A0ACB8AYT3_9AGAM|nr:hypothetical protein BV22DRAFT_1024082 [Leucogyrophana mollusca]